MPPVRVDAAAIRCRSSGATAATLRSVDDARPRGRAATACSTPDPEGGVVRRVPLIAAVERRRSCPRFGARDAARRRERRRRSPSHAATARLEPLGIGDVRRPDAARRQRVGALHAARRRRRFVSRRRRARRHASTPGCSTGKFVLVGVTALGLSDYQATPLGERMPGVEIHAQLIENIFDGALLARPRWARWAEAGAARRARRSLLIARRPRRAARACAGARCWCWSWPRRRRRSRSSGTARALRRGVARRSALGRAVHRAARRARWPRPSGSAAPCGVRSSASARPRRASPASWRRRGASRWAILPSPAVALAGEKRVDLPRARAGARGRRRSLRFLQARRRPRCSSCSATSPGKGLPGSLFMAVSQVALQERRAPPRRRRVGAMLTRDANAEISRDNAEELFVTAFAGILDARDRRRSSTATPATSRPYGLGRAAPPARRLGAAGGPAALRAGRLRLRRPRSTACAAARPCASSPTASPRPRNAAGELLRARAAGGAAGATGADSTGPRRSSSAMCGGRRRFADGRRAGRRPRHARAAVDGDGPACASSGR